MKSRTSLLIGLIGLVAAAGASAEAYDGVHPLTHSASRAEVQAEAVVAAHSPDPYAEGFNAGVPATFVSSVDRSTVRAQAVVAAHSPNPYADGYGADIPSTFISTANRTVVHQQAVATAHSPKLNVWGEAF